MLEFGGLSEALIGRVIAKPVQFKECLGLPLE